MRCVLLGDEIGLPVLIHLSKSLNYEVVAYFFSHGKLINADLESTLVSAKSLSDPNSQRTLVLLNELKVDLVLVYSYNVILKDVFLNLPNVKFLNIHGGKLPEYRGANVINWAIINGDKEIGVAIHEITKEIDAGPIISQWSIEIDDSDTAFTALKKINESICTKATEFIRRYMLNEISATPQSCKGVKVWKRRTPDDGIFDWSWSNREIYNLLRALVRPWPGARYIDATNQWVTLNEALEIEEIQKLREKEYMGGM